MSLKSFCKVFQRTAPLSGDALVKEFRKVEETDKHWEIPFRRRYLSSKEDECRSIARSLFIYGFTQWDFNTLLCGAFVAQGVLGSVTLSPISLIICFFAVCCLLQLRLHRDKLTLHYSMIAYASYIILMINLMIVQPQHISSFAGVTVVLALSVVHFTILKLLGRFTSGRKFERFADTCLQFRVPSVFECHAMLMGIISCLGVTFALVHLYYLAYVCLIVVLFTFFARLGLSPRTAGITPIKSLEEEAEEEEEQTEEDKDLSVTSSCLPTVRCVITIVFTMLAFAVSVATLVDSHILSLRKQQAFKTWESKNGLVGEYVFSFQALTFLFSITLGLILVIQLVFVLHLILKTPALRNMLQRQTIFMGKSSINGKGDFNYAYYIYTVDRAGYVLDVDMLAKTPLEGYDISSVTCYDIYLVMQRRALHALCQRTLYCHVPALHLYTADKDSNILVRNRVKLEQMAGELEELIQEERERRRSERLERERLMRLKMAFSNRPNFISTSIPSNLDVTVPDIPINDAIREVSANYDSYKRTLSIPVDLSLQDVGELPMVSKMRDRLYRRRCVTTSVSDDLYWRAPGIIDRVRGSWLNGVNVDPLPSARTLKAGTARVTRDPNKGEFNFNKIDNTLSNIFMGLEIMSPDGVARRHGTDGTLGARFGKGNVTNIDLGETPCSNVISKANTTPMQVDRVASSVSEKLDHSTKSNVLQAGIPTQSAPVSPVNNEPKSPISPTKITTNLPQPKHYIDIDTGKSAIKVSEAERTPSAHPLGKSPNNWNWLDRTVKDALNRTKYFGTSDAFQEQTSSAEKSWIKNERVDEISYERIRPIEEALEGQYYVNEKGQLVVKSGNSYVPVRYHGKRTVKKLAAFFSSPLKELDRKTINIDTQSDSEEDVYDFDFSKIVSSPTHRSMICSSPVPVPSRSLYTSHASRYIIIPEGLDDEPAGASPAEDNADPMTPSSQVTDALSNRSSFILTREYEVYSPFSLKGMMEQKKSGLRKLSTSETCTPPAVDSSSLTRMENGDVCNSQSRNDDASTEGGSNSTLETSNQRSGSAKSLLDSGSSGTEAKTDLSPRTLRRIAASQHLPLALDSRHEKVYQVFPEPRRNCSVMKGIRNGSSSLVNSVATTPKSSRNSMRRKMDGSTGCDLNNHSANVDTDSATSPGSSISLRSPQVRPFRPVVPKSRWRNEFDFSPVAIHTAEDVMRELMQDVDVADSGADDAGSDVSYDFIFGR